MNISRSNLWWNYVQAIGIVAVCTLIARLMFPFFAPTNLIMFYLAGVLIVAVRCGRGPSILASLLSVAAFDFFFVPPYLSFAVSGTEYLITFAVMLLVAITISTLTEHIQQQAEIANKREYRTASLYAMSRAFADEHGLENIMNAAARHIGKIFDSQVIVLVPGGNGGMTANSPDPSILSKVEEGVARWVYDNAQASGLGTDILPGAKGLYLPLVTPHGVAGVLGVFPTLLDRFTSADQLGLLETFAHQTALAIERARLEEAAERAQVEIETERLRNTLLSSVSHDLRTPLAAITGAVSSLVENEDKLDRQTRHELALVAYEEADRLNRLLGNLLQMTRLEAGGIHVLKEWQPLDEVVETTLSRLGSRLDAHPLTVHIQPDLSPIPLDASLIEQVLINLLENAVKYTPAGSPITFTASVRDADVLIEVADRGPGLPFGDEQRIFDKFYRARPTTASGVELGLTICAGIVKTHGGRIWAANRPGGGAVFLFTLPLGERPVEFIPNA